MKKKRVLVINLGWEQEPLLDELSSRDCELFGIHYDESYYKNPSYAEVIQAEIRDLEKITAFARKISADAVISDQCDYSYFAQAVVASQLNLAGPSVLQAQIATNKYFQRLAAKEHGLHIPDFQLCKSLDDAAVFAAKNGYPIILKPVDNRGSFGVNKVNDAGELAWAYYEALINSHSRCVLAEDFINGIHITVDGYSFGPGNCRSLALATKTLLGGKHQVAMDIRYPGDLPEAIYSQAMQNNEQVNNALGFSFGMLHSEYMVTEAGIPYLIETANRGGGVYTSEIIVPEVSGFPLVSRYVDDCLGTAGPASKLLDPQKKPVILKFFQLQPGRIKSIDGLQNIAQLPEVLRLRLAVQPGDIIPEIKSDAHRHGFAIFKARENPDAILSKILSLLEVQYEK